jgi:uncharacterized membrane protein
MSAAKAIRSSESQSHSHHTSWRWWIILVLVLAGIGVSGYLAWSHINNQEIICGQSQGCDIVDQSKYAELILWNIPVSVAGLLSYLAMLALVLLRGRVLREWDQYFPLAVFGISLSGVLFSLYLTYMELFVILGVCKWCVTSAIILTIIFVLSVAELRTVTA